MKKTEGKEVEEKPALSLRLETGTIGSALTRRNLRHAIGVHVTSHSLGQLEELPTVEHGRVLDRSRTNATQRRGLQVRFVLPEARLGQKVLVRPPLLDACELAPPQRLLVQVWVRPLASVQCRQQMVNFAIGTYPTLLVDVPAPTLRAYPKATVVAEKLHAVTMLGMTNTRMKDFFDLWVLLHDTTMDDADLQRAIKATFARRQTAIPSSQPIGLSDAFVEDATKQVQWRAFLKKIRLEAMDFSAVVRYVRERAGQFGFARM